MPSEIQEELRRFAETTTIKGVSRTVRAERRIVRVFWVLALASCSGVLLYQISAVAISYSEHIVIRNSGVDFRDPEFPDVTVCSLFQLSDLNELDKYAEYLRNVQTMKQYSTNDYHGPNNTGMWMYLKSISSYNTYTALLSGPPNSTQDLLFQCALYGWDLYRPWDCNAHFQLVAPLQWCQTIRNGVGSPASAALSLLLFINAHRTNVLETFDSWIRFSDTTGVRVMVHRRGTIPDPLTAISVSPGTETTIFLKQTDSTHLPYPYGNCTERQTDDDSARPDSLVYNVESCLAGCRQRQVIEKCGCIDPFMLFTEEELHQGNHRFCNNVTDLLKANTSAAVDADLVNQRLDQVMCMWNLTADEDRCDCRPLCSETTYETTVTTVSNWPKPLKHLSFYEQYLRNRSDFSAYEDIAQAQRSGNLSSEEILERLRGVKLIEENFLQIIVRFDQKRIRLITDVPAVTWETMASNLGGSFNLWLGISVPTAAELIELVYSMVMIWWQRKKPEVKPDKSLGRK